MIETEQIRLKLTEEKDVLKEMKRRKVLKRDQKGDKYIVQFDAQEFTFRPGSTITVGRSVAKALQRSSAIIMGDDLTGDMVSVLVEAGSYKLGDENEGAALTRCPVCKKDMGSLTRLSRHISVAHKGERPDLYDDTKKPEPKTDWEAKLDDEGEGEDSGLDPDAALVDVGDDSDDGEGNGND